MALTSEIESLTIVFVGSFNPQIFQPLWFTEYDLVRKSEAEAAEIQIIHPELVSLKMGEFQLQVGRQKFALSTMQPQLYEPLRDLVVGTFQILTHTPVSMVGINTSRHYRPPEKAASDALEKHFVPMAPFKDLLKDPSLQSVTLRGQRPDDESGYIVTKIEPSGQINGGIYVEINDHYDVPEDERKNAASAVALLQRNCTASVERLQHISSSVAEKSWAA